MKKAVSVLMAFLAVSIILSPVTAKASSEEDVLELMNSVRESAGLEALEMDDELADVAYTRAVECSERFSHTRPNGKAWYTVSTLTKGENLAHARNFNQQRPENVVYAWTISQGHYANLTRGTFSSVGIAYYVADNGDTYIACEFK